jgi:hypothetical protein
MGAFVNRAYSETLAEPGARIGDGSSRAATSDARLTRVTSKQNTCWIRFWFRFQPPQLIELDT